MQKYFFFTNEKFPIASLNKIVSMNNLYDAKFENAFSFSVGNSVQLFLTHDVIS